MPLTTSASLTDTLLSCLKVFFLRSPSAIANQEMLSGLEVEMRKLEGMVKELVDEMEFLQRREERFTNTNREFGHLNFRTLAHINPSVNISTSPKFCLVHSSLSHWSGHLADIPSASIF